MATDLGKVGMVMKGDWNSSATYEVLDAVTYNSGLYIAKTNVPANTLPTNTSYWQAAIDISAFSPKMVNRTLANTGSVASGASKQILEDVTSSIPSGYRCIGITPVYSGDDQFSWVRCSFDASNNTANIIVRNDSSAADSGAPGIALICVL